MPAGGLAPGADSFGRPRIPSDLNDEIWSTDRDWFPPMNSEGRWIWLIGSRCLARCLALPLQLLKAPMIEFLLEFPSGSSYIEARERYCGHPCPTPPPAAGATAAPFSQSDDGYRFVTRPHCKPRGLYRHWTFSSLTQNH